MSCSPSSDAVLVNQLAWRLAAGIAAVAAFLAVILTSGQRTPAVPRVKVAERASAAPAAALAASSTPAVTGGNVGRCVEFCVRHVTTKRSFVVFSNGTCVIVDEPSSAPIVDAIHTLEDCSGPNARFITREIEDGNYLVTYRRAVFNCLFADEIEAQRPLIESNYLNFLTSAEKDSMPEEFNPPFHAKLGLLARAWLNRDALHLSVAKVVRAKPLEERAEFESSLHSLAPGEPAEPLEPSGPPAPSPPALPPIVPPLLPGA